MSDAEIVATERKRKASMIQLKILLRSWHALNVVFKTSGINHYQERETSVMEERMAAWRQEQESEQKKTNQKLNSVIELLLDQRAKQAEQAELLQTISEGSTRRER